jgi:hypothetical protein
MIKQVIAAAVVLGSVAFGAARVEGGVVIVDQGRSDFTIVVPAKATESVKAAAQELQKDIALATGAELTVVGDDAKLAGGIISVGSTRQATAAGVSAKGIEAAGFRIVTKGGNLYILGQDTPEGQWTEQGGFSNGTANGVYTFLEESRDVRWLMPGGLGRDVPRRKSLEVADVDRTQTPAFSYRDITQLHSSPAVDAWKDHQRLGSAWHLAYMHNWAWLRKDPSYYQQHPEWFAMDKTGKRPPPKNVYFKLETTNQELVKTFAQKAIETLKNAKRPGTFSLSPSDGSGWSQSLQSKALYDPSLTNLSDPEAPAGKPVMSSLVLKWYHDIAQIVAKEYPQGKLAGLIYSSYVYPPTKYTMKLPDNFTPVICGIGEYGYGLYRKDNQKRYNQVMDAWAKVAPKDWFYYGLPNDLLRQNARDIGDSNFPGTTAIVAPAAPDILNFVWDNLRRNHMKGADIYGQPSWSDAAMANYIVAQMMWNPKLDAYAVQKEWLDRAYGTGAGAVMRRFYKNLNGWFRDYYQKNPEVNYKLTLGMLKDIYAAHFAEMENEFLEAQGQAMTGAQKERLQLIGDNLIVLEWRLRNGGLWPANLASKLERGDDEVIPLLTRSTDGFELFPGIVQGTLGSIDREVARKTATAMREVKVRLGEGAAPLGKGEALNIDENVIVIYAVRDGQIRITPQMAAHGAFFASYVVAEDYSDLFYPGKPLVVSGILNPGTPITFSAKAHTAYYLYLPPRTPVRYRLSIENAATAEGVLKDGVLSLYGESAPVYVYYQPQRAPIGVVEQDDAVTIQKPFSAGAAKAILLRMGHYRDVRIGQSLDLGWRFSPDPKNDGMQRGVTKGNFDDSSWKTISALNWWQAQGFGDYHGPAWYRITFTAKPLEAGRSALLYFGAVDGNAVIYLNGKKIKEHTLGPDFEGWNKAFFAVTRELKAGKNTLVVEVTSKDQRTSSGMFKGVSLLSGVRN